MSEAVMFERLTSRGRLAHRCEFVTDQLSRSAEELTRALSRITDVWTSAAYADQADADAEAAWRASADAAGYAWHRIDEYLGELSALRVAVAAARRPTAG